MVITLQRLVTHLTVAAKPSRIYCAVFMRLKSNLLRFINVLYVGEMSDGTTVFSINRT